MWPGWVWVGESQAVSWRHLVVMTGIAAPALKGDAGAGAGLGCDPATLGSWAVML